MKFSVIDASLPLSEWSPNKLSAETLIFPRDLDNFLGGILLLLGIEWFAPFGAPELFVRLGVVAPLLLFDLLPLPSFVFFVMLASFVPLVELGLLLLFDVQRLFGALFVLTLDDIPRILRRVSPIDADVAVDWTAVESSSMRRRTPCKGDFDEPPRLAGVLRDVLAEMLMDLSSPNNEPKLSSKSDSEISTAKPSGADRFKNSDRDLVDDDRSKTPRVRVGRMGLSAGSLSRVFHLSLAARTSRFLAESCR